MQGGARCVTMTIFPTEVLQQEAHGSYRSIRQSYQKKNTLTTFNFCENASPPVRK